jgi:hypothetical protein
MLSICSRYKLDEKGNVHKWLDETFNMHIWMLNKFLEWSKIDLPPFQLYVIAACFRKMLRRMDDFDSAFDLAALKNLENFEFSEQFHAPSVTEIDSDRTLLNILPHILPHIKSIDFPKLRQQIEIAKTLPEVSLYTNDTCVEYHLLLCTLLDHYHQSLKALQDLWSKSVANETEIRNHLLRVLEYGFAVRSMVRGSAMTKHLKVIEKYLPDRAVLKEADEDEDDKDYEDDENEDEDDKDDEDDEDDEDEIPTWKRFIRRLTLMVVHFDAIQVLSHYVGNAYHETPSPSIPIHILSSPVPDQKMLNWRDVLKNSKYFPEILPDGPSVEEIIRFLDPAKDEQDQTHTDNVTVEKVMKIVTTFRNIGQSTNKTTVINNVNTVVDHLRSLTPRSKPVLVAYSQRIVDRLKSFQKALSDDSNLDHLNWESTKIATMVDTLGKNTLLYNSLKNGRLNHEEFGGSLHCEISLASKCSSCSAHIFVSHIYHPLLESS